jgi:hypothetical protein
MRTPVVRAPDEGTSRGPIPRASPAPTEPATSPSLGVRRFCCIRLPDRPLRTRTQRHKPPPRCFPSDIAKNQLMIAAAGATQSQREPRSDRPSARVILKPARHVPPPAPSIRKDRHVFCSLPRRSDRYCYGHRERRHLSTVAAVVIDARLCPSAPAAATGPRASRPGTDHAQLNSS